MNDKDKLKTILTDIINNVYGKILISDICEALDDTKTYFLAKYDKQILEKRLKK